MAKAFEDAFRTIGILEDDDPSHVAETVLTSVVERPEEHKEIAGAFGTTFDASHEDYVEITLENYEHTTANVDTTKEIVG